ncbi:MAG: hypothetical protein AAF564_13415 [Bacteroidota bacterium]
MNNVLENNTNQNDMIAHLQQLAASSSAVEANVIVASGVDTKVEHLALTNQCEPCLTDAPGHTA